MHRYWIAKQSDLPELTAKCLAAPWLAIDMEFHRRKTFFSELCLIQIATTEWAYVIDVCSDELPTERIKQLLCTLNNHPCLIFHSASQDIEIWHNWTQRYPDTLFDTQTASILLAFGLQISFAQFIQDVLFITVDKSQQLTNWRMRPLKRSQIDYAFADVCLLAEAYQTLIPKLTPEVYQAVIEESSIQNRIQTKPTNPLKLWWRVQNSNQLSSSAQLSLQQLCAWRYQLAIEMNRVARHIVSDQQLVTLALSQKFTPIKTLNEVQNISLKQTYQDSKHLSADQLVKPVYLHPAKPDEKQKIKHIQELIAPVASNYQLTPETVASKKRLVELLRTPEQSCFNYGWRHFLVGDLLREDGWLPLDQ